MGFFKVFCKQWETSLFLWETQRYAQIAADQNYPSLSTAKSQSTQTLTDGRGGDEDRQAMADEESCPVESWLQEQVNFNQYFPINSTGCHN